jgi:2-polyprenyl-3-methyl-5-hydroxy-6-metoxy-1,4-benzoquinol methylase
MHQEIMLGYYRKSKIVSESNTEYLRVVLARDLVNKYALPRLSPKLPNEITFVDVGCSVGLFAIEFAKMGYNSFGVDFDAAALEIAAKLNAEEGTNAKFFQMDVSDWDLDIPIDIALCFDIFEHLHDDELGALLYGLKRKLAKQGCLVFHTLPLQYDYLFWGESRGIIRFPWLLRPFKNVSPRIFGRMVKIYALCLELVSLCRGGLTHEEAIKMGGHCNPLTRERLADILARAGYDIIFMESGFLGEVQLDPQHREYFHKQPITHRSLRGVAAPKGVR